jgi:SAM-dependent methyltransferase
MDSMDTPLTEYASCVVCASRRLSELADAERLALEAAYRERIFRELFPPGTPDYMLKDRAYPTQTYDARLVVCEDCGTLARDPHMSPGGALEEYEQDVYHSSWLESSFGEFRAAFAERMPELLRWVGPRAHVLEVGSFVGGFLAAAEECGWQAEGVDVGRCVTRFARSRGLVVHTGGLIEAHLQERSFDAVFVWDCFDQLPRPWQTLSEIHRILTPGGCLLIRVPNGQFVRCMQGLEDRAPDLVRRVLAFAGLAAFPFQLGYTASSLGGMLGQAGFESIHVQNRINLRESHRESATLRCVHASSQLLHHLTLGSLTLGPWIEVSCNKAGTVPVRVENEQFARCIA